MEVYDKRTPIEVIEQSFPALFKYFVLYKIARKLVLFANFSNCFAFNYKLP